MANLAPLRETNNNLRAQAADKSLIDRAAELLGQSRSSFMIEASVQRAEAVLADQTRFVLDADRMAAFLAALESPMQDEAAFRALMGRVPIWER